MVLVFIIYDLAKPDISTGPWQGPFLRLA